MPVPADARERPFSCPLSLPIKCPDLLALSALVGIILAFFYKTVFLRQPISKISYLSVWDTLFSQQGCDVTRLVDPSGILLQIPFFYLVANLWRAGQLPLWNPYSGCGSPLAGDIESTVLSPVRLLFALSPAMQFYNLLLVFQVILAAVFTFALARELGLSRLASIFASLTFALCPYILFYLELLLGTSYCLFPLVFWLFVRLARKHSVANSFAAGAAAALSIVSGHPEAAFWGIIFSATLMSALTIAGIWQSFFLKDFLRALFLAGLSAFCLSAPVLLPFLEYLANSDCYKFGGGGSAYIPWQALAYSLIQPGFGGASAYPGVVAALMLPLAGFAADRRVRCLMIVAGLAFLITTQFGPLRWLFVHWPLSALITIYAAPVFLLLVSLIAGFGLEEFIKLPDQGGWRKWLSLATWAAVIVVAPVLLRTLKVPLGQFDYDAAVGHLTVSYSSCRWTAGLLAVLLTFLFLKLRFRLLREWILPVACIALGIVSQGLAGKDSLPVEPRFDYRAQEPLPFLQASGQRVLATGNHIFRPNTNVVFGIQDLRCHKSLFPRRYLNFMQAAGGQLDRFDQHFDGTFNSLLDLASVRYILSLLPVQGSKDLAQSCLGASRLSADGLAAAEGLRLQEALWRYDPENRAIQGKLCWRLSHSIKKKYSFCLVLLDGSKRTVWYGDQYPLCLESKDEAISGSLAREFAVPIPVGIAPGRELFLALEIFDWDRGSFVVPIYKGPDGKDIMTLLGSLKIRVADLSKTAHFKLLQEFPNHLRIYENTQALPQSYVVHKVRRAHSAEEALRLIRDPSFNPHKEVVLEEGDCKLADSEEVLCAQSGAQATELRRQGPSAVQLKVRTLSPGVAILTDTFYPGWQATLDGKGVPILSANYLYRAVRVPAGEHIIEYRYVPFSFWLGIMLAGCCATIWIGLRGGPEKMSR